MNQSVGVICPASAAFGSAFVLLTDTIAKISRINGLPVGVICSMIGGPLFIWILINKGNPHGCDIIK
ncbi:MAG: iron chelate uptake ABC transporter family permease subunit [Candidatus Methanomethylophilaceae archaeon]|nr:iron chelate uptake ABC transporter family permease subunit [Candidatus Methanomethylophilaceae archaeon]MDY5871803.1 iron chelate uptake ABC transporter family permease subunit [Candidatus Methanomethylophilaceae archaeon]